MSACTVSGTARFVDVSSLDEHPCELLGVERVAARSLEERGLRLGREDGCARAAG